MRWEEVVKLTPMEGLVVATPIINSFGASLEREW